MVGRIFESHTWRKRSGIPEISSSLFFENSSFSCLIGSAFIAIFRDGVALGVFFRGFCKEEVAGFTFDGVMEVSDDVSRMRIS